MKVDETRIVKKFNTAQDSLVLQQSDLSLQSIATMVQDEAIDISPRYQRRERWGVEKESGLIESFLLNIPVPPIYLAEDEYGTYSVIDGKQRVTAITRFLTDELKLNSLEKFSELEGCKFSDLPNHLSNALKIRPYLRVVTLLRQSDPDLKHEVFLRLNKAGVALNSQEIRNVAFRGKLNDSLLSLSENSYLRKQLKATKLSKVYREMVDVQYVLRFFTVREYWKNFPGNMDSAMDIYMSDNYRADAKSVKRREKLFLDAIEFCETVWGAEGFAKPGGSRRVLQGMYDIQMVCSSLLSDAERSRAMDRKDRVRKSLIAKIKNDDAFSHSITQFTSNPKNLYYRIDEFLKILRAA